MSPDDFISQSIDLGASQGISALDPLQRLVFLISQAEVLCDMEGIDTFVEHYPSQWWAECAASFAAVGALEIAEGFQTLQRNLQPADSLLDKLNELITGRHGYSYEAIRAVVISRIGNA